MNPALSDDVVVCGRCGALVYERDWHSDWHREIEGQR